MNTTAQFFSYRQTGSFSKMLTDYIAAEEILQPFYAYPVSIEGIKASIKKRTLFNTDRTLLVEIFKNQYQDTLLTAKQSKNVADLSSANTFTICTAHQPNIFTGQLYFIYKIVHAIKLAEELKIQLPENNFVPVYYMGSEDADLDELGYIFIKGEKYQWHTQQTGAVGRMKVDKALIELMELISGQLLIYPFGKEIISLIKKCYQIGATIEAATFLLINELFAAYGLLILLPDSAAVKNAFAPIIKKELAEGFSHIAVKETVGQLPVVYKAQASGRDINLFYLLADIRERIEKVGDEYIIVNTNLKFNEDAILAELAAHPERFSPNVILRPVLQETILPDIAFIGGGGEIAYWLELKKVFEAADVPYPMLIARNSFLFINKEMQERAKKLQLHFIDLFKPGLSIINQLVKRDSKVQISLENEKVLITALYDQLKIISGNIDVTLQAHAEALQKQALQKITALEKKMLRAEKRKFETQQRQVQYLKAALFPNNNLQERIENMMPLYALWGKDFIKMIGDQSKGLDQQFGIILE